MADIIWSGIPEVNRALNRFANDVQGVLVRIAERWAPVVEAYAKDNRNWTDRTGNARAGLHTLVEEMANQTVVLWLSHGVDYGLYLELAFAERYAIIEPTLQQHYNPIMRMLREVFGG